MTKQPLMFANILTNDITKVHATLGWEQEYFFVDTALFSVRPDFVLTGRTLIGNSSPKNQQLEDHYLGTIRKG